MKTIREIQAEARQLTMLSQQYRTEQSATIGSPPRVLARLSASLLSALPIGAPIAEGVLGSHRERYVDAIIVQDEVVCRLMEREPETQRSDLIAREDGASVVMASDSAFDVLYAGYTRAEQERLSEQLAPYTERDEDRDGGEHIDREAVDEVEAILETDLLSVADRMRTKTEIAEFLCGRREAGDLISHVVERQCAREGRRETLTARNEIRLTIDEP